MITLGQNRGRLCWQFRLDGKLHRVFTGLPDTREHRRGLKQRLDKLRLKFATRTFDLETEFPDYARTKGLARAPKPTLFEYARRQVEESTLGKATRYDYESLIRHYIEPVAIAHKPLDEITRAEMRSVIAELTKGHIGTRVRKTLARYKRVFAEAVQDEIIDRNPMPRIPRLRSAKPETDPFTAAEVLKIVRAAKGAERSLVETLFGSGARVGEILAAEWNDIDWTRGVITIRRTVSRFGVGLPKTQGSQREIAMLPEVRKAIQAQRARSALRGKLVFPNRQGKHMNLGNLRRRAWTTILERAGVPYRPIMFTRHTYAIRMLDAGHVPTYVAGQLGHTSVEMVWRHYARWMNPGQREEARKQR